MVPINYRPILINGVLEASYPSSTTLLVLSVMPTLKFQIDRRIEKPFVRKVTTVFVIAFSVFMVIGRLTAGVHWATGNGYYRGCSIELRALPALSIFCPTG